ncbi:RlpA-like double-psi beta-barrel domain-containing protein [Pontibacter beigongshangensis]|uniref:hypothetical protein n=1 Tax=Pontibacter beigongshangensis TaxID=2574733 RepID=UPI001F507C1A|nr:hypothetical protein [Pontibacter beigongshangensis]
MIRIKLLAIALSIFMVLDEEFSVSKADVPHPDTNKKSTIFEIPKPEKEPGQLLNKTPAPITVTATVYFPEPGQTDDTPFTTADGSKINEKNPGKHRWIAVSRDLHSRWGGEISYGDSLLVSGISEELDGLYIVRDTMNKRIRKRIDILVGRQDEIMGKWKNVQISKFIASSGPEG